MQDPEDEQPVLSAEKVDAVVDVPIPPRAATRPLSVTSPNIEKKEPLPVVEKENGEAFKGMNGHLVAPKQDIDDDDFHSVPTSPMETVEVKS
jgi:hypothetical protein